MNCADVMTKDVPLAQPSDTARDAARRMRERNLGVLPVCDRTGRVLGAVTDRDMTYRIIADDHPATTHIREVMTAAYPSCLESDDISVAARHLAEHEHRPLLVTDAAGRFRGLISDANLSKRSAYSHSS
jgi:CBS domain-containing protein